MQPVERRAVLLLADISGYTRFMVENQTSAVHGQMMISYLIETILAEVDIPLVLHGIEGDAVFLSAPDPGDGEGWDEVLGRVRTKLLRFFEAFLAGIVRAADTAICDCASCHHIEDLARDPARRLRARAALKQLPVFRAEATPTLLFLVEEGCALKEAEATRPEKRSNRRDVEDWQDVLGTGLSGLCRLGTDASPALAPLLERLHDGRLPVAGANRELLLVTLVRLGADPGQLRGRFLVAASPKADGEADRFDWVVERARTRPDCAY